MIWEKPAKGTLRAQDPNLYAREPPKSIKRLLMEADLEQSGISFELDHKKNKVVKMYDIADIKNELEDLSESFDEEENKA